MGIFDFFNSKKRKANDRFNNPWATDDDRFSTERQDRIDRILENITFDFNFEIVHIGQDLSVGKCTKLIKECIKYYVLLDGKDRFNVPWDDLSCENRTGYYPSHIYIRSDNYDAFISMSSSNLNRGYASDLETDLACNELTASQSRIIRDYLHQIKMFEWITGYDPIKEVETFEEKLLVNNENELQEFVKKFK